MLDALFRQYNARHSTAKEVARTFVPPDFFHELCAPKNVIIIGPRGSGKTTLLKMLTTPALENWQHDQSPQVRHSITYTSVYVPSDITWREQFIAVESKLNDPDTATRLARAAFTCHLQRAFVTAVMNRLERYSEQSTDAPPFRRVSFSRQQEDALSQKLSARWLLEESAPTLPVLRELLSSRIEQVYNIAENERILGPTSRANRLLSYQWLNIHYLHSVPTLIEIANNALSELDGKWAFLFDELEIAPPWLQQELYASLRSIDQRVMMKLAIAPYMPFGPLVPEAKPLPLQDYTTINLLGHSRKTVLDFCNAIWEQLVQERQIPPCLPKQVLGASRFGGDDDELPKYSDGSDFSRQVNQLKAKDRSFSRYVEHYEAQPSNWGRMAEARRAQVLRKAYPIIYLRNYYLRWADRKKALRKNRKAHVLFAGYPAVFTLTEGNPRLIKGVLSSLLDEWRGREAVDAATQARILRNVAEIFKSTLSNAVAPQPRIKKWGTGVVPLLNCIASYLASRVYGPKFDPDPVSTFEVDRSTLDDVAKAIGVAANLGGVIQVADQAVESFGDVYGKRYRLCYLLGLLEVLPVRVGRKIDLSEIVASHRSADFATANLDLLFEEEEKE